MSANAGGRVQILKGSLNASGKPQEKVYDVAWPGSRKPGKDGKVPAVGNTVITAEASYSNAIGAPYLAARVSVLRANWTRVAVRVGSSWLAAAGGLMLGWLARGGV